jgi:pSer/pThr/pTyr-binding forkhead associated (FHA) protein
MLFVPPRPPVKLPGDGIVRIGRASDSELRLDDADTSRRHAQLVSRGGVFTLRDLDSTNGTFVNGQRIQERQLAPGDRIDIGENQIVFCQVEAEVTPPGSDSASTVFRDQPSPSARGRVFSGDLSEVPPYAVLQILELGRNTGELLLEGDAAHGRIWIKRGTPVHAETKGQVGFDAALTLANVAAGRFAFEPTLDTPETTITASVTELLLEASRLLDEQEARA